MIEVRKGWKVCADCGEIKGVRSFYGRTRKRQAKDAYCKVCRRRRAAAHYAAIMADPERREAERIRSRDRQRRRRATDPEFVQRERERHRAWLAGLSPERREQLLQDNRIRSRLARERKGLPTGRFRQAGVIGAWRPVAGNNSRHLDPAPLLGAIGDFHAPHHSTVERALSRLRGGGQYVTLAVIDAVLVAYGRPDLLEVLYPDV
jgi:hypothetical protein